MLAGSSATARRYSSMAGKWRPSNRLQFPRLLWVRDLPGDFAAQSSHRDSSVCQAALRWTVDAVRTRRMNMERMVRIMIRDRAAKRLEQVLLGRYRSFSAEIFKGQFRG